MQVHDNFFEYNIDCRTAVDKALRITDKLNKKRIAAFWNEPSLKTLKKRIKKFHLMRQKNRCCYCRSSLHDEFSMVIDIEHILPKSKFGKYVFHIEENLSISCKRCNMRIKKDRVDFLDIQYRGQFIKNPFKSSFYKFIHPNYDRYDEHIRRVEKGTVIYFTVLPTSKKAHFTYQYFELEKIHLASIDKGQGTENKYKKVKSQRIGEQIKKKMEYSFR